MGNWGTSYGAEISFGKSSTDSSSSGFFGSTLPESDIAEGDSLSTEDMKINNILFHRNFLMNDF